MSAASCAGCSARLRGLQWLCRACWAAADRAFKAQYPYTDPTSHQRNRNRVFGDRTALLALVRDERAIREGSAA